jgi:hypothetical protein
VIRPCREQVREALPAIFAIASRLRDGAPVDAMGVGVAPADRQHGPCYNRLHRDALNAL